MSEDAGSTNALETTSTSSEDLEDGYAPDESLPDLVDDLEARVLHQEENPLLDVDQDADAKAVQQDTEHSEDDVQPPA
ncbi:MAG: hypothetical protein ACRYF3_03340 [Janthinobacterium lividum]